MREKASALLQIADGKSPHAVTLHGLLKPRDPDAVYGWLNRYEADGETIYVVFDNSPVHFHPDVLAPLQSQSFPLQRSLPANWQTERSARAKVDELPIRLLRLPTYASWLNPIEKLWRWLKQEVLHMHRNSDSWPDLKERVDRWLAGFSDGSTELLRYVGLLPI